MWHLVYTFLRLKIKIFKKLAQSEGSDAIIIISALGFLKERYKINN